MSRLSELFPNPVTDKRRGLNRRFFGVAAGIAILAAVLVSAIAITNFGTAVPGGNEPVYTAVYKTAIGGLSSFQLPDGSQLTLNTNSHVEIEFSGTQRNIRMHNGELHIDVAHDPARPLNVIVGERIIQAVGTAFTVKIDEEQHIELLVTDGTVKVGVMPTLVASADQDLEGWSVSKGQRMLLDESNEVLEWLEPDEIDVQLSWRDGNLIFSGESLGEAVAEISRYTPVEFVFLDEDMQKIRVAGLFKTGDITGFLSSLNANFDIVFHRIDEETIQLSSADVVAR